MSTHSVVLLLSIYNGEPYLQSQLDSISEQSYPNWTIAWRDDGSEDKSVPLIEAFARRVGPERCVRSPSSGLHLGASASFLKLLSEHCDAPFIAFADQDDRCLPDKLLRAVGRLSAAGDAPALYCSRQWLTDEDFTHPVLSVKFKMTPGFPASLTQNIATGNTIVMNQAAAKLVASMPAPDASPHDWWCYIVVSACGGQVIYDPEPAMLYRQHAKNLIGSQLPVITRAIAALERGPEIFMTRLRRHAQRLDSYRDRLTPQARLDLDTIRAGLSGTYAQRLAALRCAGFRRATGLETLLFRIWFLTR